MKNIKSRRQELLVKVAHMYYIEGLSQEEIAKKIFLSRSYVSRLLKACREEKIVEIRINDPSYIGFRLQTEIKKRFKLDEVMVIPSGRNREKTLKDLGETSARYLESILEDHMLVGLAWGKSLYYMVEAFKPIRKHGVEVVQLLGGSGARDLNTDGLELARKLAVALNANCYFLQAPLVVQSKVLRDLLLKETDIARPLGKAKQADIAVVGLGTNNPGTSALVRAGYLTAAESQELSNKGIVGDICGYQIDIKGNICSVDLNERIIGISPEDLKKIPRVIGVASGTDKGKVILGALRGAYINTLITDEAAALGLLSLEAENKIDVNF